MKKIFALTIIASTLVLTGGNTISGMGKDIQKAGQEIQGASGH